TAEATKDVKVGLKASAADLEKAKGALVGLIKDHTTFVADYQDVVDREQPKGKEERFEVKLKSFTTKGDKAVGIATATWLDKDKVKEVGKEETLVFTFVKIGDGWKIIPEGKQLTKEKKEKEKEKEEEKK